MLLLDTSFLIASASPRRHFALKKYHQNCITFCVGKEADLDAKCYNFYVIDHSHNIRHLRVKIKLLALNLYIRTSYASTRLLSAKHLFSKFYNILR